MRSILSGCIHFSLFRVIIRTCLLDQRGISGAVIESIFDNLQERNFVKCVIAGLVISVTGVGRFSQPSVFLNYLVLLKHPTPRRYCQGQFSSVM